MMDGLTLDNFEAMIDSEILQRGRQYYKNNHVDSLEAVGDGVWEAVVVGTDNYDVTIEDTGEGLICDCTCPYDWGPYCKHIAAVLYAIRDEQKKPITRPKEKQQAQESVESILKRLTHEQLVSLLSEQVKKDKTLANHIKLHYGLTPPDKTAYAGLVRDSLRAGQNRHGFIDYGSGRSATKGILELLNKAEAMLDTPTPDKAIPILQAVIETVTPALQSADDSGGEISGCISIAFEHLEAVAELVDGDSKRELFNYCLTEAFQPKYQGWDYCWSFLEVAAWMVKTLAEREQVFAAIDRLAGHRGKSQYGYGRDYASEHGFRIKAETLKRLGGSAQEHHAFLLENVHLDTARQELVRLYIEQKQYAAASKLCIEAVQMYRSQWPGLVTQYQQYLLDIADKEGNTERVVELAETLLLEGRNFEQYYKTLKQAVSKKNWPAFVEDLVQRIQRKSTNRWMTDLLIGEIYARENMWERLMALVPQNPELLRRFREPLEKHFPYDISVLYEQIVLKEMAGASNRDRYRELCALLQRMKKLGQSQRAAEVIELLKADYPKRRAMIEELNRV